MFLNSLHRKKSILFYFFCFTVSFCWLLFNASLLHQLQPVFFTNRLDFSLNILLLTDLPALVIRSSFVRVFFDTLYFLLPALLVLLCLINHKFQYFIAVLNSIFNFIYALLISSLSASSIEGFVGWILLPLVFAFKTDRGFYYALSCVRYIFLLIFFSAGVWKIRAGGIFNAEQMSGILAMQHSAYIAANNNEWFTGVVKYLIGHSRVSYILYLAGAIGEFAFCIGFFTKKFDRLLITIFLFFVLFNFILMRINYFSWVAFLGCLWFSKYSEPEKY